MKPIGLYTCAGILVVLGSGIHGREKSESLAENTAGSSNPRRSTFIPFSLPSFNILRNPFQGLTNPSKVQRVRTTKTEYVEVTRRQTVHPMCYTTYEPLPPCLSHRQDYPQEDRKVDSDAEPSLRGSHVDWEDILSALRPTRTIPIHMTAPPNEDNLREPRHLHIMENAETALEGSDIAMVSRLFPSEVWTKTVLINKVERYTDHHVTATLLAVNCVPTDRNLPACHPEHGHPVKGAPDGFFEDRGFVEGSDAEEKAANSGSPARTPSVRV